MDLFMETSAKSGFNVEELFCNAAKILYEESMKRTEINKVNIYLYFNLIIQDVDPEILNQVKLSMKNTQTKKKKKCC